MLRSFARWPLAILIIALSSACATPLPALTPTPTAPPAAPVVITQLLADLTGTLEIENGCIRVEGSNDKGSFLLVWPPDLAATIEGDSVRVVSGLVSGIHKEVVLQAGQSVDRGGGTFDVVNDQLKSTEPSACPGPYWVASSEIGVLSGAP